MGKMPMPRIRTLRMGDQRDAAGPEARVIARQGARVARAAREIAGVPAFVAGSIGPLFEQPRRQAVAAMIREQAVALREGGADFIFFETQPNRLALERCAMAMRHLPDVPFVLSFAIVEAGETASGESVERMLAPLPLAGPGKNCTCQWPIIT